jgi:membrane associated rhomboid family serine protease
MTPDTPTPADVLRMCAAAAPNLWFPAQQAGVARDSLDDPLWLLRQAGLIQVGDWVRGLGQGFLLTPAGQKALADPNPVITPPPKTDPIPVPVDDIPPEDADLAHVPEPTPPPRNPGLTAYDRGELTREAFLAPRPTVVTPVLIVANVGWFLVGLLVAFQLGVPTDHYFRGVEDAGRVLHKVGAAFGPDLLRGEWWRLLTAGFVHVGLMHLLANLFSLYMIGPVAEGLWGRWRFAGLYLIAGLAGTCAAMAISPTAGVAGASGSIWGVMLAVVVWLWRYRSHLPEEMVVVWLRRLLLMLVINVAISFAPGVSWEGHFGGGLAGFLAAIFLDLTRPGANRRQLTIGVGGLVLLVAAMAGGLAASVAYAKPWKAIRTVVFIQDHTEELQALGSVASVSPPRLEAVHKSASFAAIVRTPDTLKATRENLAAIRAEVAKGEALDFPGFDRDRVREYLAEVTRFAELWDRQLASGKAPGAEERKALADQLAKATEAWKRIGGG